MDEKVQFYYGRCPCCDRIIAVPPLQEKVYCCFCGSQFLAHAAAILYIRTKNYDISINNKPIIPLEEPTPKHKEDDGQTSKIPILVTVRRLCELTGMRESTVRRLLKEGKLPAIYSGNRALIHYEKFCEMIGNLENYI